MKVLVVKTSSLGDVIHTLPALTDATHAIPGIRFDWVVEQAFAEVPGWHPAVDRIIPVAIREWRKHPLQARKSGQWSNFKESIGTTEYQAVIDAQGLLKSAWLTRYASGRVFGLDKASAREPLAARFYDVKCAVAKGQHAVERVRQLFATALGYAYDPTHKGRYDLNFSQARQKRVVLLHGTTWPTKHWSEVAWQALAKLAIAGGYEVCLPWGNEPEKLRAKRIAESSGAQLLDRMTLTEIARLLAGSAGCVTVDTGLGHLAAAVDTPTVALFGPTNPALTACYGEHQAYLNATLDCVPCMARTCRIKPDFEKMAGTPPCLEGFSPDRVFDALLQSMSQLETAT